MSTFWRKIGEISGKMANKPGLISGAMSTMDPKLLAEAVNESASIYIEVMDYLDPKVLAEVMSSNPDFMAKLIKNLDAEAIASAMNKNQRFITQMIEHTDPNVFTRATNVVFNKIRKATYRPGLTVEEDLDKISDRAQP
jgi:hypothetical protein